MKLISIYHFRMLIGLLGVTASICGLQASDYYEEQKRIANKSSSLAPTPEESERFLRFSFSKNVIPLFRVIILHFSHFLVSISYAHLYSLPIFSHLCRSNKITARSE